MAGLVKEQPYEQTDDSADRHGSKEPAVALSESEHSTLVDCGFDAEVVFDPLGGRLLAWESFPSEYSLFGKQVDASAQGSEDDKESCAAKDHS